MAVFIINIHEYHFIRTLYGTLTTLGTTGGHSTYRMLPIVVISPPPPKDWLKVLKTFPRNALRDEVLKQHLLTSNIIDGIIGGIG